MDSKKIKIFLTGLTGWTGCEIEKLIDADLHRLCRECEFPRLRSGQVLATTAPAWQELDKRSYSNGHELE